MKASTRIGRIVSAAVGAVGLAALLAARPMALAASPDEWCWRSLELDTGAQDQGLFIDPSLAAIGSREVWLSWLEDEPRILRWSLGHWTPGPVLARQGAGVMWNPMVAASPSGRVIVIASANRDDGTSELHVGRAIDGSWEWLGAPLIASREPFTHAQEASIAFMSGDRPVVAWSEERNVELAGLFVARWDGSSWRRLGVLAPKGDDYFLSPAVAVDTKQQIWLAWNEAVGGVRVARWNGSAWLDVGRDTLEKVTATQGRSAALPRLSLAVDGKGHIWLLRLAAREPSGAVLALARWDGARWAAVPAPRGPAGKDSTVWPAAMIVRDGVPMVGWSQSDESDNHHFYLAEWAAGDRWTARLSGLHLVEGVSNVVSVRLAAVENHSVFISWDERGKDQRRTRLVQAYPCPAGETPAAPPKSVVERDTWPTTVDEAARRIVAELDDESKARVRATKKDQLTEFYFGWGMGIRNAFGLWRGNDKLLESCGHGRRADPEECSMAIIEAVWTLLQTG